jgi:hypothetical protein
MSIIALPSVFRVARIKFRLATNQRASASPFGGSEQVVDLLNDRWIIDVTTSRTSYANGQLLEAYIASMRGQTNTSLVYHVARPIPSGTVRGTLTLNAAAAQGQSFIVVAGCNPTTGTLLPGDYLSIATPTGGTLLVMVSQLCTAVAGVITVPLTNRLRVACSSAAAVTWSSPTVECRLLASTDVEYEGGMTASDTSLTFGEKI